VFQGEREGASEQAASIRSESKADPRMTKSKDWGKMGASSPLELSCQFASLLTLLSSRERKVKDVECGASDKMLTKQNLTIISNSIFHILSHSRSVSPK